MRLSYRVVLMEVSLVWMFLSPSSVRLGCLRVSRSCLDDEYERDCGGLVQRRIDVRGFGEGICICDKSQPLKVA